MTSLTWKGDCNTFILMSATLLTSSNRMNGEAKIHKHTADGGDDGCEDLRHKNQGFEKRDLLCDGLSEPLKGDGSVVPGMVDERRRVCAVDARKAPPEGGRGPGMRLCAGSAPCSEPRGVDMHPHQALEGTTQALGPGNPDTKARKRIKRPEIFGEKRSD